MTTILKRVNPLKLAKAEASPRPLLITKGNSLAATGQDLRFWKQHFPHLVRRVGNKDALLADDLEREVSRTNAKAPLCQLAEMEADPVEAVLQILRNKAGGC